MIPLGARAVSTLRPFNIKLKTASKCEAGEKEKKTRHKLVHAVVNTLNSVLLVTAKFQ